MFRRALAVLAVALLAASCSSPNVLANVNGEDITEDDLLRVFPEFEDPSIHDGEALRQAVSELVTFEAVVQAAEVEYGFTIEEDAIEERMAKPPKRYRSVLDPEVMVDGENDLVRGRNARLTLLIDAVVPELIADEFDGFETLLAERPDLFTRICLRQIVAESSEEAQDVMDRLAAGEDFVSVMNEVSPGQADEGRLLRDGECLAPVSAFPADVAALVMAVEVNEPLPPIPAGNIFSIFRVEERLTPTLAELEAQPMEYFDTDQAITLYFGWASEAFDKVDIEVSPVLGTWSSAGFGITPPPSG